MLLPVLKIFRFTYVCAEVPHPQGYMTDTRFQRTVSMPNKISYFPAQLRNRTDDSLNTASANPDRLKSLMVFVDSLLDVDVATARNFKDIFSNDTFANIILTT